MSICSRDWLTGPVVFVTAKMCGMDRTYAPTGAHGAKPRRAVFWSSIFFFLEEREAHLTDILLVHTKYDLYNGGYTGSSVSGFGCQVGGLCLVGLRPSTPGLPGSL